MNAAVLLLARLVPAVLFLAINGCAAVAGEAPALSVNGLPLALPSGAPAQLAAVVHGVDGNAVTIVDIATGSARSLPVADTYPKHLLWSPGGERLLYQIEDALLAYDIAQQRLIRLLDGLPSTAMPPFALSPDGELIAVARSGTVRVLNPQTGGTSGLDEFTLPENAVFQQFLWTPSGRVLLILTNPADAAPNTAVSVVRVDVTAGTLAASAIDAISRLLGWDAGRPVAVRSRPDGVGEQAGLIDRAGAFLPLRTGDENEAGEFVVAYAAGTRQVVVELGGEDLGDAVELQILAPADGPARPWLARFQALDDLSLSADGRWATFVDGQPVVDSGDPGGDVYLAPLGRDEAQRLLRAEPGELSYSNPVFRP